MDIPIDIPTIVAAIVSAIGVSLGMARWLTQELIKSRLQRDLEERKTQLTQHLETYKLSLNQELERTRTELQKDLARDKALVDGVVRKEIETQLGESAAQRQYELEARRRLYLAVGPLRFQLLLACRDLAGRVESMGLRERYDTDLTGYYGRSTVYRILRPIAVGELIEELVALADFLIDPAAIDCLRFRRTLTRILSGDEVIVEHPHVNWEHQEQHIYADSLSSCANMLIDRTAGVRVLRFSEFDELITLKSPDCVAPFDSLMQGFGAATKPLLWVRLVAYANACNQLVKHLGGNTFEPRSTPVEELLKITGDKHIIAHLQNYVEKITSVELVKL